MDNFTDSDIVLFINKYEENVSHNPLRNQKIPLYVQYLRAKKHFRDNSIDEDIYFKKRLNITKDDLLEIHKLIDKIKRGKDLTKSSLRYGVAGNYNTGSTLEYSGFDENDEYENTGFELLNEVSGAMDQYYQKMKKVKNSRNIRQDNENYQMDRDEQLNRVGSVEGVIQTYNNNTFANGDLPSYGMNVGNNMNNGNNIMKQEASRNKQINSNENPSRYYYEGENSERPNIDYSVHCFAKSELGNMGTTSIIQKLDKLNSTLNDNELINNDFDTQYKRAQPRINCNKKFTCHNEFEPTNYNELKQQKDINQIRFWQDKDILDQKGSTKNKSLKNKSSFENQFDYLPDNPNHTPDPRLIGTSSRLDNRSMMKK